MDYAKKAERNAKKKYYKIFENVLLHLNKQLQCECDEKKLFPFEETEAARKRLAEFVLTATRTNYGNRICALSG